MPFLIKLRDKTMRAHFENSGVDYEPEAQLQRIKDRLEFAQIIVSEGKDIGLLKVDKSTVPWELVQIQVIPEMQGKGLGEKILRDLLCEAKAAGVEISLRVLAANPAKKLYARLGFRETRKKDNGFTMLFP